MKMIFIRHGKTAGNLKKRYIGRTDEPLCRRGIDEIADRVYPDCEIVLTSDMRRCIQTAKLIYPGKEIVRVGEFRECDFGDFEGKDYRELSDDPDYRRWIESGGELPFPNGEAPEHFKKRCISGFERAVGEYASVRAIALVVHGGTIMSILERYARPRRGFYDYRVENGSGFLTDFDGEKIRIAEKL
ncbi:MAG: histidine phosphatase family protein [Bacteroides sp.]|nr:histidine phosphatase family protein [Eubacterium sp.]MCM1417854.1 histidine phosphatase family protein [Roseburia sp.]MCM1461293.1 histidine phosphatase family protein [Bacteroides sp.]